MITLLKKHLFAIICVLLLVCGVMLVAIQTVPIHVLKDFHIKTDKTAYGVGEKVKITSQATKTRRAGGIAHRTIECDNGKNRVVGYTINDSEAKNPPGKSGKPFYIVVPNQITPLPAHCRVVLAVQYRIFTVGKLSLRTVTENAVSNDFVVK